MTDLGDLPGNAKVPVGDFPDDFGVPRQLALLTGVIPAVTAGHAGTPGAQGNWTTVVHAGSVGTLNPIHVLPGADAETVPDTTARLRIWATLVSNGVNPGIATVTVALLVADATRVVGAIDQLSLANGVEAPGSVITPAAQVSAVTFAEAIFDVPANNYYALWYSSAAPAAGYKGILSVGLDAIVERDV